MPTLSTHIINKYFDRFNSREIAFNKSIIEATGLEPKKVFLKIKGEQWSCVLYSCSMTSAKIIAHLNGQAFDALKKAKNITNLRLSFLPKEYKQSIVFFIPSNVLGVKNFKTDTTFLMNLSFTQRPPSDLIEILGNILQEKENFEKRKDIRITLDSKITADIGLATNKGVAVIDNIKRPCIIKNLSASGGLIIISCVPKFIMQKPAALHLLSKMSKTPITMLGKIVRHEPVEGRKDIHGMGIEFDENSIPLEYKRMLNNYFDKLEDIAKTSGNST